jgi:hypothetical protein
MSGLKVFTSADWGDDKDQEIRAEAASMLGAAARWLLKHHDVNLESGQLVLLSVLVGMLQHVSMEATAKLLHTMLAVGEAGRDPRATPVHVQACDLAYAAAHRDMLMALKLHMAAPEEGGRA